MDQDSGALRRGLWFSLRPSFQRAALLAGVVALISALFALPSLADTPPPTVLAQPAPLGPVDPASQITITLVLPLSNKPALQTLLAKLYTPGDPLYGHYLTPLQFASQYGAAQADVDAVAAYAKAHGITVKDISANRTLIHLAGSVAALQSAFGVQLYAYRSVDGSAFHRPRAQSKIPPALAGHVVGVLGLDTSLKPQYYARRVVGQNQLHVSGYTAASSSTLLKPQTGGKATLQSAVDPGNPMLGGYALDPENIRAVYNLPLGRTSGKEQILAVFEADGWTQSDIYKFEDAFGIPRLTPALRSVDSGDGTPTPGGAYPEATLDIDMALALSPQLSNLIIYQIPGYSDLFSGFVDSFAAFAQDDAASILSVSYGVPEYDVSITPDSIYYLLAMNQILLQIAVQGQTVTVASGDSGAYEDQTLYDNQGNPIPSVSDPASQPGVLAVGGTLLYTGPDESYQAESSWADPYDKSRGEIGTGGGGGVSVIWSLPSYQVGAFDSAVDPQGSTLMRNVPDVSLFGDYDEGGYSVYITPPGAPFGSWAAYNGTSASAPLWASYLANVNEARLGSGLPYIGLSQNAIYPIATTPALYPIDFHDVNDGSDNLLYKAVKCYDNSTGWGSFNGANLLNHLAMSNAAPVLVSLTFNPDPTTIGGPAKGTVALTAPAGAGGATVTITNGAHVTVATAVVPVNASSATFSLPASVTASAGTRVYYATYARVTKAGALVVKAPPAVASLSFTPNPTLANLDPTATLALTGPAPYNGAQVEIYQDGQDIGYVTVGSGTDSLSFTYPVAEMGLAPGKYTLAAAYNNTSQSAPLTVLPAQPAITASITPPTLTASGGPITITATVTDSAAQLIYVEAILTGSDGSKNTFALSRVGSTSSYAGSYSVPANLTGSPITYQAVVEAGDQSSLVNDVLAVGKTLEAAETRATTVTSGVTLKQGPLIYNSRTGVTAETATLTNVSGAAIAGPADLAVIIDPTSGWTLTNPSGTIDGVPYVLVTAGALGAGLPVNVTLRFSGPAGGHINANYQVLSGLH